MALTNVFKVAISDEFLDAFAKIPRSQQQKVMRFVTNFKTNPTAPSINYEKISTFRDQNLRTVRIDQAYRAIILKPEQGNVYVLLWVDHHDKAMEWGENKRVVIHPETGSLQILTSVPATEVTPEPVAVEEVSLYQSVSDQDLISLAVPPELLSRVRGIRNKKELDALRTALPQEAYEALFFLSEGDSLQEVKALFSYREADTHEPSVNTEDFAQALTKPDSQQRFFVIDSEDDDMLVDAILNAPLEKWRIFLHPAQRRLVSQNRKGPVRVLGGAGTGKTVVAMHRAAHLVQKVFHKPEDRILFTTFTRNLAADIQENLRKLVTGENLKRIEVVHLDKWVTDLLNRYGYKFEIEYYSGQSGILKKLWQQALTRKPASLSYPDSFYREEWEFVVQRLGCEKLQDYFTASRQGRGVAMGKQQKKLVWAVFEEYRNLLSEKGLKERADAIRDAEQLLKSKGAVLPYRAILVDEAQDMGTEAFRLLRAAVPEGNNDLFIVGDGHQRIYPNQASLSQANIKIVGRSFYLRINYRTTDEIRASAVRLLEGQEIDDLDGGRDTTKGNKSLLHGAPPRVVLCPTFQSEIEEILRFLAEDSVLAKTCLVARTEPLLEQYQAALHAKGIETYRIKRSQPDESRQPGLRLATMHRVKGLEFERVVIAGATQENIPLAAAIEETEDRAVRAESEQRERALLYVALTRAKRSVLITSYGTLSAWLKVS